MKLRILEQILGSYYKSSNEYLFFCPKCNHHKRKLSVNINKNAFHCWTCDFAGPIDFLIREVGNRGQIEEWQKLSGIVDHSSKTDDLRTMLSGSNEKCNIIQVFPELPKEFTSLVGNSSMASQAARKYLFNRGIKEEDITFWKIGYCIGGDYDGRLVFPSFDANARLNYFVARTYKDDFKKYTNPPVSKDIVFNELMIDFEEPITLVEGIFDAVKAGENSIPLLGSSLSKDGKLFQKLLEFKPLIYIALDSDAKEKENKMIKMMLHFDLSVCKVPVEPFKDVGEMSKQVFKRRKDGAQLMSATIVWENMISQKLEVNT